MIDQTRAAAENKMLGDLKDMVAKGENVDFVDQNGTSPVRKFSFIF